MLIGSIEGNATHKAIPRISARRQCLKSSLPLASQREREREFKSRFRRDLQVAEERPQFVSRVEVVALDEQLTGVWVRHLPRDRHGRFQRQRGDCHGLRGCRLSCSRRLSGRGNSWRRRDRRG